MRLLTIDDLNDIVYASVLFGGGGGGSAEEGFALVEEFRKADGFSGVKMISLSEMPETESDKPVVSTMVAALGSPIATKGKTFVEEAQNAVKTMKEAAETDRKVLKYIYSGEQGGGNTMLPIYTAWTQNMPILDLDGNGRAVPAMNTGLQPIYDVPTSPVALASGRGDAIIARTQDPCDSGACENIARYLCQAYDQGIGFAAWLMDKKQHANSAIGQISLDVEIGKVFKTSTKKDIIFRLKNKLEENNKRMKVLASGKIKSIDIDVAGGFDNGITTIIDGNGDCYEVLFQNENLVCYKVDDHGNKEALATVPGIISIIDFEPENESYPIPVSNTETVVGHEVAVVYIEAPNSWYSISKGYDCWKDILISAGYCKLDPEVRP